MKYDVIVIGSGSAGATAAARLSEDPHRSVLLLEAGPDYPDLQSLPDDVRLGHATGADSVVGGSHDWRFHARATDLNPAMPVPRGYVVGGTSAINGQVFLRGIPEDFDAWAAAGNPDWSWDKVLPYYRKLETDLDFGGDYHGKDGPILVRRYKPHELMSDQAAFTQSCRDYGFGDSPDHNEPDSTGVGPLPLNNPDGIRWSTALGYLMPARGRLNLTIRGNCLVRRILFDLTGPQPCAIGVEVESPYYRWGAGSRPISRSERQRDEGEARNPASVHGDGSPASDPSATPASTAVRGQTFTVYASEILLSGGPISSPQLLMLSGIGQRDHLASLGIPIVADLPGVGQNLRDHPTLHVTFRARDGFPMPDTKVGPQKVALRYTAPGSPLRNDMMSVMRWWSATRIFMISAAIELAKSAGSIRLRSLDPHDQPELDYNLLDHPEDVRRLREGVRLNMRLGLHPAFREILGEQVSPAPSEAALDTALDTWMLRNVQTMQHISGTCKMGPDSDPMAVLDQKLRVRGVGGLRVADCSVMPDCIRANTNATAIMIGERVADFIKGPR